MESQRSRACSPPNPENLPEPVRELWRKMKVKIWLLTAFGVAVLTPAILLAIEKPSQETVYVQSFEQGPDNWEMGRNKTHTEGVTWHKNIFGYYGEGVELQCQETGGHSGRFCYSESPWYFDDNHGQFAWLFLIANRRTEGTGVIGKDLRNATVRVSLRGRDLQLNGAHLYFWVQGPAPFIRDTSPADRRPGAQRKTSVNEYVKEVYRCWAFTGVPLQDYLKDGKWHSVSFELVPDESQWSFMGLINGGLRGKIRVIQSLTSADGTVPYVLGNGKLYNWGFNLYYIDPLQQPTGKIDIDEFSITTAASNPPLPE